MLRQLTLLPLLALSIVSYAQRGKHTQMPYATTCTVTSTGYQMNSYTAVTANVAAGATTITVANNAMTSAFFTTNLSQGDLIMIIQMQGASMDVSTVPTTAWGGDYTTPIGHEIDWNTNVNLWGQITNYNNCGKYELREVRTVTGTTSITLNCATTNAYTTSGHVQVVRIPRLSNLTLNANTSIVPALWDGTVGGIVALEVDGPVTFGANAKITASAYGFRGGVTDNTSTGAPVGAAGDVGFPGSSNAARGAEKGEGIAGFYTEYDGTYYSRYCKGAPANGGGGGNVHNAGGGGGANVGTGTYYGYGVPSPTYTTAWNLETQNPNMVTTPSSGGGRGGYSYATSDQNELSVGPNNAAWLGDYRRNEGGYGGHPLALATDRIFMGGGGGAGEMNGGQGGGGGRGGGIVFLQLYGTVSGTLSVDANGAPGINANASSSIANANSTSKFGNDGAGGAGGAGAVIISNGTALPGGNINANGGKGGDQALSYGNPIFTANPDNECDGPGGGGSGGQISVSNSGSVVQSVTGGASGIVSIALGPNPTTNFVANFPPNGATGGASGIAGTTGFFDINVSNVSICTGNSATLTATVVGALPAGVNVTWYNAQYGGTALATGTSYTTPTLSGTTTYYVGTCPGTFRKPVVVTVGGPTITGTAVVTNATCSSGGSITGLSTTGGVPNVVIDWNGVVSPTMNLSNASAGSYTVTVTDGIGCFATSGPYIITSTGGPTINTTNMVVTNESCLGDDGSITGITTTGTGVTPSWSNSVNTLNNTGLSAGSYTLTVMDINGCTATTGAIPVGLDPGPSISDAALVVTDETCGNGNGSIVGLQATGNSLTYSWNGTTTADEDYTGLSAGSYTLTVTDNLNCTASYGPVDIVNIAGPTIDISNAVFVDEHCGSADGSITGIQISGGQIPYTISWNGGAYNTLDITALPSGNYTLSVSDGNGCPATAGPFTLDDLSGPTIDVTNMVIDPESCVGGDGSITGITATGTGLTYQWNLITTATIDNTGLGAGNYALLVTDQFDCMAAVGPYTVPGPVAMSLNTTNMVITPAGCTVDAGAIEGIQVVGGVNPQVTWSNSETTLDITGLSDGPYTIDVIDDQGCTLSATFNVGVTASPVIDASAVVYGTSHCGQSDGSISGLVVNGGTTPYDYEWDGNAALNTLNLTNAAPGNHTIIVTDDMGCTDTEVLNIPNQAGPSIDISQVVYGMVHCGQNDGSISGLVVTGGTEPYDYEWDGNAALNTLNLTNTTAGTHTIIVTDDNGCTDTETLTVPSQAGPVISTNNMVVTNSTCEESNGAIQGIQVTGSGPMTYAWAGSAMTSLDISGLSAGTYTLTATDAFGCSTTAPPVTITTTPLPFADFSVAPNSITPGTVVTFTDETTNATPVVWEWITDGQTVGTGSTATYVYLTEGTYTVQMIVFTASGCSDTVYSTIEVFGDLLIPNVITRNGDGINDAFEITNLKPNTTLRVENRWGSLVFETNDYQNDWKGIDMGGVELTEGTYFYQLITPDGKIWQGNVYLLNHQ